MIQTLYEFVLYHSVDSIKMFNFLTRTFPTLERNYINRMEKELEKVYVSQADLDRMTHNVWQRLCKDIPSLDKSKF